MWNWAFTFEILPVLAQAAIVTVEATALGFVIAAVLGLVLASIRLAAPGAGLVVAILVELIRSTPLLIQIFFLYFVLPKAGIVLDAFTGELDWEPLVSPLRDRVVNLVREAPSMEAAAEQLAALLAEPEPMAQLRETIARAMLEGRQSGLIGLELRAAPAGA